MSLLSTIIHHLYEAPLPTAVRESEYAFPIIQTFHVLGLALMVGTIAVVDLRILGVILKRRPTAEIADGLLPVTWAGFVVMAISGGILFAAQSEKIYGNIFLQLKLLLLVIAGINVALFHLTTYRAIQAWSGSVAPPAAARASAAGSLLLWALVVIAGRYIAYY
jgi:hypothetical protein